MSPYRPTAASSSAAAANDADQRARGIAAVRSTRSSMRSSVSHFLDRQLGIERPHRGADGAGDRRLARVAPHDHAHERQRERRVRQVDRRLRPGLQVAALGVADDADDRHPRLRIVGVAANRDALADRILPGPLAVGQRLVDDDDARPIARVGERDIAPAQQRDAHRLEIARRDRAELRHGPLGARLRRRAFDRVAARRVGAAERRRKAQRRARGDRVLAQSLEQLRVETRLRRRCRSAPAAAARRRRRGC